MAKVVLNVTLAVEVETDIEKVSDIVDNLSFKVEEITENVEVKDTEIVEFFDVPC